jgi:hypothetical protein
MLGNERRPGTVWQNITRAKYSIVMFTVVLLFVAVVLLDAEENVVGVNLLKLTFSLLVMSAALASSGTLRRRLVIGPPIIVWLVLSWTRPGEFPGGVDPVADILLFGVLVYLAALLIKSTVVAGRITLDTVSGGIAAYLLLALAWAVSFHLIDILSPGSFTAALSHDFGASLYFSLVTITTLGYGDIAPVASHARIWTVLEAVVGLLYVAVIIARLVADFRRP